MGCIGYCTQAGLLAVLETWGMLPTITDGKAQSDYVWIPEVSKQLRDLLESNKQLRLRVKSFTWWYYIEYNWNCKYPLHHCTYTGSIL